MKTIYLDRQLVIEHFQGGEVAAAIDRCKAEGTIFPYSPAHVEEIANADCNGRIHDAAEQLSHLEALSDGWAIMPALHGPADLRKEDVQLCFHRVRDDGGRGMTEMAVAIEANRTAGYTSDPAAPSSNGIHRSVDACTPQDVFSNPHVRACIDIIARERGFRIRTSTFQQRESTFATLFDVLNACGFRKEHSPLRTENRLHDVSHAIYASYADLFATNDRKLRQSAEAVYLHAQIDVPVLDRKGMLDLARDLGDG